VAWRDRLLALGANAAHDARTVTTSAAYLAVPGVGMATIKLSIEPAQVATVGIAGMCGIAVALCECGCGR
jgi:predicted amino acid dehydrogenase